MLTVREKFYHLIIRFYGTYNQNKIVYKERLTDIVIDRWRE